LLQDAGGVDGRGKLRVVLFYGLDLAADGELLLQLADLFRGLDDERVLRRSLEGEERGELLHGAVQHEGVLLLERDPDVLEEPEDLRPGHLPDAAQAEVAHALPEVDESFVQHVVEVPLRL
jgi:hypothetical protein